MSATETKGIALITGASSGIGAVYADRLVRAAPPELRSEHGLVVAKDDVLGRSIAWRIPPKRRTWRSRHASSIEPQEITMTIHRTIVAAAFALASIGVAHADELRPIEPRIIDLGEVSGVAYYTVERDGFRLVATLGQGETGTPVRFEAVLVPGQSVVLSTPREPGVAPDAVQISRQDDQVVVHEAAAVTN